MQCILYKIYFWKGFSYVLQIDMHLICAPMLTKFYSCKKWVLQGGLHPNNGRDLSTELDKPHMRVDRIDGERTAKTEQLSQRVVRISSILVNLGLLPIQDIPQLPKSAWEVLPVVDLILKRLQEALASYTGPWD
jgi:hypothetical protein